MARVVVYGKPGCSFCTSAKGLLERNVIEYDYIDISEDKEAYSYIIEQGHRTVPQIYIDKRHIGGYNELLAHMTKRKGMI